MIDRTALADGFPLVDEHPDVAGVWRDAELLAVLGPLLAAPLRDAGVTTVVGPEARGMVLAALVAVELGTGVVCARKAGRNHPGADITVETATTWRGTTERFQLRSFDLARGDRVAVVDDWVTTGSSLRAVRDAIVAAGATYVGASVMVDKTASPDVLDELGVTALVRFDDLVAT